MALPALQQNAYPGPGSPAELHRDLHSADTAKRRADDQRRLRRVKDSREQLKRTRARGASSGTIDTSTTTTSSSAAGRSYTVGNVHHGVIYLRYATVSVFASPSLQPPCERPGRGCSGWLGRRRKEAVIDGREAAMGTW